MTAPRKPKKSELRTRLERAYAKELQCDVSSWDTVRAEWEEVEREKERSGGYIADHRGEPFRGYVMAYERYVEAARKKNGSRNATMFALIVRRDGAERPFRRLVEAGADPWFMGRHCLYLGFDDTGDADGKNEPTRKHREARRRNMRLQVRRLERHFRNLAEEYGNVVRVARESGVTGFGESPVNVLNAVAERLKAIAATTPQGRGRSQFEQVFALMRHVLLTTGKPHDQLVSELLDAVGIARSARALDQLRRRDRRSKSPELMEHVIEDLVSTDIQRSKQPRRASFAIKDMAEGTED